jgi:hypothetical protein
MALPSGRIPDGVASWTCGLVASDRRLGRTRPACHRDHRGHHAHSAAALRAHRRVHHGLLEHPGLRDDRRAVHRGLGYRALLASCRAGQSSAWASSPGSAGAFPAALGGHREPTERGRQADAVPPDERRPNQDAADGADPFPAMRRRGCCRDAGYQDAAQPERRGALQWNRDVAAAWVRGSRQSGQRARPGRGPAVCLDAEPALAAAAEPRADSAAQRALRARQGRLAPSRPAPRQPPPRGPEPVFPALPRAP